MDSAAPEAEKTIKYYIVYLFGKINFVQLMAVLWSGTLDKGESHEFNVSQFEGVSQVKITYGNDSGASSWYLMTDDADLPGSSYLQFLYQPTGAPAEFSTYVTIPVANLDTVADNDGVFYLSNQDVAGANDDTNFTVETIVEETSACPTCQKVKPIPQCSELLRIGNIDILDSEEILVVFTRRPGNKHYNLTGTTDENGLLSVSLEELEDFLTEDFVYEIMAFASINDYKDALPITINGNEYTCLSMPIDKIINPLTGQITGAEEITLEIDED